MSTLTDSQVNIVLHPRQSQAFTSRATEILYGGAAGGGKSHLMRAASIVWCSEIPGLQAYLFRRISDDLFKNHMAGPGSFPELLAPWLNSGLVTYNGGKNFLQFWNGARIWMCHCQYEKDMFKYQGAEIHVLLVDELTHFTEKIYRFLRGRCRLGSLKIPPKYAGLFPRVLNGSNPGGIGHTFVRRMFVNGAAPMDVRLQPKGEGGMLRQFIPARIQDNPTLMDNDPGYLERLDGLGSPELVRALKEGDWNIVAGGALDDLWTEKLRVPRFKVPAGWRLDRSLDWGSAAPFSVGWWAEADGTEATWPDGTKWCPPKGTLVRIHEWYGSPEVGTNVGVRLGSTAVARGVKAEEELLRMKGWIAGDVRPGPADNAIESVEDDESDSIAKKMRKEGVAWTPSDKSPGSRKVGLQLVRDRLTSSHTGEGPGLFFCTNCTVAFATLPVLPRDPRDPEDVDSGSEDHLYDEVRYRCLADRKRYAMAVPVRWPT
jgi:hypothetical protein